MGQNALSQSDCKIFKLTISPEQNDEKARFFAFWYRFMEIGLAKKCVRPVWSQDLKFGGISRRNLWNILVCGVLKKNSEKPKVTLIIFGWW